MRSLNEFRYSKSTISVDSSRQEQSKTVTQERMNHSSERTTKITVTFFGRCESKVLIKIERITL
jgi:hypothetical protein